MKTENVYIATLPRSGSTLVGMLLGAHSQVFHVGESAYWSKLDIHTAKCCCGEVKCKTLIKISKNLSCFLAEVGGIYAACSIIDFIEEPNKITHPLSLSRHANAENVREFKSILQTCCKGLDIVADTAREVSGKNIVVENSKYIPIAEMLLKTRNNWKVLIVARDPRGAAFSSKKAGERKGVPRSVKDKLDVFLSFAQRASLNCSIRSSNSIPMNLHTTLRVW